MKQDGRICILFEKSRPFFNALGDPVRQELLLTMMGNEYLSVKQLTAHTKRSRPTISHHLRILKEAGIITEYRSGRETFYRPQSGEYFEIVKELIQVIDTAIENGGNA